MNDSGMHDRRMRIIILAHAGAVHTRRWCRGLAARGYDLRILTQTDFLGIPESPPTDLLPGRSAFSYLRNLPRVRKIIKRFDPDIVHAHYATGYGLWGAMQKSAPLIVTVWGTDIAQALAGKPIITSVVRMALKKARFVTAPSRFLLEETIRFEPSVEDKAEYIPFGIEIKSGKDCSQKDNSPLRLIFSKQFYSVYAPKTALKAFAAAIGDYPDMELTMIGGGPLKGELESMTQELEIKDKVTIHDWVAVPEAERMIKESDIMLMPSRQESFGVAALEASAAGVPVIATAVGGIPEIVEHDVNGLLIPVDDEKALAMAIIKLAGDKKMRLTMGRAGMERAKNRFDFNRCLDQMESLYHRAAGVR